MTSPLAIAVAVVLLSFSGAARADQNNVQLNSLFQRLRATNDFSEAMAIEQTIWAIWRQRGNAEIDAQMSLGIETMNNGALKLSLEAFDGIVRREPEYAEGWNKRATVHYLMGNFDASVYDISKTLALEPRHFGALSGMGLIYSAIGKAAAAIKVWEKALTINPHMLGIKALADELRNKIKGETT